MANTIVLLKDAVQDLEIGRAFYEKQRMALGSYFWQCLLSDLEALKIYAGVHIKIYGLYRMKSKRFPYAIYYEVGDETVYVMAVLPMRRESKWIRRALKLRST